MTSVAIITTDPALLRWNMDERYLAELQQAGIPGVPTSVHDAEGPLAAALARVPAGAHVVLKPTVGAGTQQTGLFAAGRRRCT